MIADCPRCGAQRVAFVVCGNNRLSEPRDAEYSEGTSVKWEVYGICQACLDGAMFVVSPKAESTMGGALAAPVHASYRYQVVGHITIRDGRPTQPPEHLRAEVKVAFEEAAKCRAVGCPNAAGAMFRLCLELATRKLLPEEMHKARLADKLKQLFAEGKLPQDLRPLSSVIKDDGNDATHHGTLDADAAADMEDFTIEILRKIYTEEGRAKAAQARRDKRRQAHKK